MGRHFCSFFFFFFFIFFLLRTSSADNTLVLRDTNGASPSNGSVISTPSPSSSPPPPPPPPNLVRTKFSPFRPSIAVIVGVLTTMFSVTLLLLLYAKHCKRSDLIAVGYGGHSLNSRGGGGGGGGVTPSSSYARKNSGIDRSVIESLPVFRFGSLMGQKDGLECAVCLTRFESSEVLRLLPKCKHAFHVECVDTWLDAHSTCPLCRYRVDPEDILLVEDSKILNQNQNHQLSPPEPPPPPRPRYEEAEANDTVSDIESQRNAGGEWETSNSGYRRVSGRHSSAGERGTRFLQVLVQKPGGESGHFDTASFYRRSLDSWSMQKKKSKESVGIGCFDRPRKDGLLLTEEKTRSSSSEERRVEHRIIISPGCSGFHQRWSDVQPSDLLYLRSEMIISDSRRFSGGSSRASTVTRQQNNMLVALQRNKKGDLEKEEEEEEGNDTGIGIGGNRLSGSGSGRTVINSRSVSEITGLSRFSNRRLSDSNDTQHCHHHHHQQLQQQRQARLLSRWLAFISPSRPPPTT